MAETISPEKAERRIYGRALRALRLRRGFSAEAAAAGVKGSRKRAGDPPEDGISKQAWQAYEAGVRQFTPDQKLMLTAAIGSGVEELELERARILGHDPAPGPRGFAEREPRGMVIPIWGRAELDPEGWKIKGGDRSERTFDLHDLLAPSIGVAYAADDQMPGKADPGAPVIFDRSARPAEGKGCVVETKAGDLYPRLYVGMDAEHVMVRSLTSAKPVAFRRAEIKGVYAVKFWGD